jgi:RNA polymerase sigma factor (sigma-70 family)
MHHDDQPRILEDLRSGDPARESHALRTLMNAMLEHAARELGARRQFVNAQAESVVQHAFAQEFAAGSEAYRRFADDQHLYGRLTTAVTNRIRERLRGRKNNARHLEQLGGRSDDAPPEADPASPGMGPGTVVARRENRSRLDELNEASRERLLGATPAADRELVQLVVFEGRRSEAVAAELGLTADTVRARMSRLRRRLRECLLGPVLASLGDDDRTLVEALFIERIELEVLSQEVLAHDVLSQDELSRDEARGTTAAVLAQRINELVRTPLVEALGDEGVVYLMRLLGKPKR